MLRLLNLVDQFNAIVREVGDDWAQLRLEFAVADGRRRGRAAALLGPANPGLSRDKIRFAVVQRGAGIGTEAARRLLRRLVREGIDGTVELRAVERRPAPPLRAVSASSPPWERA